MHRRPDQPLQATLAPTVAAPPGGGAHDRPLVPDRQRLASAALPLVLLALWLLATLGLRPLLLPDEGRYANVAREMLAGDLWVPTQNGLPFFHKPPLLYWLDMAAMQVFGLNEFAARIGPMLGAWLMGAVLFLGLRRRHGARVATTALLLLATCPLYFVSAQYVNHDMLVAGLITLAIGAFVRALEQPPRVQLGWLVTGWVACALAMLAKGLIGFVLPAWVLVPWLLWQKRWVQTVRLLHPIGLLAAAVVAAPWFLAMQARYPGFYDYFFIEQHFRRFAQASFNNLQPFWFFILVLPAATLPWSVRLPQALRLAWSRRDAQTGLYAWWVVAVVVFFSLPSSKIVGYVLPALAPWCALLAGVFDAEGRRQQRWFAGLAGALCLGVVLALAWQQPKADRSIARVLAARFAPGDRVVMMDQYLYDLPFYAALKQPVVILSDWADPALSQRDNWRKELFDAARFDPARGAAVLRPLAELPAMACGAGTSWWVIRQRDAHQLASVAGAERVLADKDTELWRTAGRPCP